MAAAVDGEVDASDEAGGVRRQEGDALGHFVHLAWSAQRVGLLALFKKLNRGEGGCDSYRRCCFIARGQEVENLCSHYRYCFVFCKTTIFLISIESCIQGPRVQ